MFNMGLFQTSWKSTGAFHFPSPLEQVLLTTAPCRAPLGAGAVPGGRQRDRRQQSQAGGHPKPEKPRAGPGFPGMFSRKQNVSGFAQRGVSWLPPYPPTGTVPAGQCLAPGAPLTCSFCSSTTSAIFSLSCLVCLAFQYCFWAE